MKRGLSAILQEVEESMKLSYIEDKKDAKIIILDILERHGSQFIFDILEIHCTSKVKKTILINKTYNELIKKNPSLKKKQIREMISKKYNISDKAVQKHIYKSRIK